MSAASVSPLQATIPHIPVLLDEVIDALDPQPRDVVIDATFGAGGYTRRLLSAVPGSPLVVNSGRQGPA